MQNEKQGTHLYIAGRMIKLFTTTAPTDSIDTQDFGLAYFYVNFYNNEYTYINEKLIKV
ncbi:hypothetical protein SKB0123_11670 [Staphylococcus capitis]|nr:hypothetical protein GCM10008141_01810 [Staphylococcus capitis]